MLKHLQGWLQDVVKQHKWLEAFNNIWLSVQLYLDIAQPQKVYEEVSNWQGKAIEVMSWFHVAVLRCALRAPSPSKCGILTTQWSAAEFYFYAQYDSHDEEVFSLMDDAQKRFHTSKRVFRQFRVTKKVTHQGKEYRKRSVEEHDTVMQAKSVCQVGEAAKGVADVYQH